jgi:hypothetical protein
MSTHKTVATNTTIQYERSEDGKAWLPVNKTVSKQTITEDEEGE